METPEVIRQRLTQVAEEKFNDWVRPHRHIMRPEDIHIAQVAYLAGFCGGAPWAVETLMEKQT